MNILLNRMYKTRLHTIRTFLIFMLLLIAGSVTNEAWAAKVTYHILTLPIDPSVYDYKMKGDVTTHRLEAFKVVVDNQTTVELPAHYKSPLATGFTYYEPKDIEGHGGSAISLYDGVASRKGILYDVKTSPTPTPVAEGTTITTNTAEYYVVYTYNESNTIAKLDGSVNYNIGVKDKGFLALNRGRNNRPAVIPTAKVDPEMLASPDFSYVANPGNNIGTYWNDGNNKNTRDSTESKFFFIFKFEGKDPYHIVVRTSYARDYTFIEKNEDGDKAFVYKWYKGAALMSKGNGNTYLASDDHIRYSSTWVDGDPNPQDPSSVAKTGYFHGNDQTWGTVALLNNTSNTGYVFMGTRTVDGNGNVPGPNNNKYYYLTFNGYNNLNYAQISAADATKSHTMDGIYPLKKVTFKVATPFYAAEQTNDHIVSVADWVSQYTVENDDIETKYLPSSLKRKYCNFTGKFYSDALCTHEITKFSDVTPDPTEGYQIYIGYNLTSDIPFEGITPAASYTADTWANATWYELTDDGSTRTDGLKLKYDGTNFKNNGADNDYAKTTEYAFIGDPYELRVVLRSATAGATPYYVGANPATTGTNLTASKLATEGYIWELPDDVIVGSFLLRKYKGSGNWYWDAGHPSPVAISYSTKAPTYNVATANAQTVTFNVSDLGYTEGDYILVTKDGTNPDQVTVSSEKFYVHLDGTATFTAAIKGRGDSNKTFTLSIQKYNSSNVVQGEPSVVTVNQTSSTLTANTVQYSTENSTRVKTMELPEVNFTYNIVDTHSVIAIKATVKQTIYTPISGFASIPEVIRSPFLADETVRFYSNAACNAEIHETYSTSGDIYVNYTVANLGTKSIKLDGIQQFKVKLNEEHIYYDASSSSIRSTPAAQSDEVYSWILEGGDPYAMKIKNVGNSNKYVQVHDGTWGDDKALDFVAESANGSRFIAMMSVYQGVYEMLAASGTTDYYHIARPSETGAETRIYSVNTSGYDHGDDPLRFELSGVDAIIYHLIDKSGRELLTVQSFNPRLVLPAEYQSPLVEEYYYYPTRAKATSNSDGDRITELKDDTKEDGTQSDGKGDNHIYVTYKVNDVVKFNTGQYMLKFLDPYATGYHLEDGNDKLTTGDKIQAVYPYCNGDGNLNIYGNAMQKEQFGGGANTRPRWVWYFVSTNSDPYHVQIRSKSNIKYNNVSNYTYLTTYAVHFNQDPDPNTKHIVTGGTLPGVASADPMEYMVLGSPGKYKLLTTQEISDGTTTERRNVTSFEQYWKTYNMIKLHVLGINKNTDAYSDDASTWVVPADKRTELETKLVEKGVGAGQWHSYNAYANATRWNGFNDKSDGAGKKVVENLEHWFQTFDMGNGTFDIESADIPPVLVLLDRHGWEIMRRPLPTTNYPEGEELAGLRVYDSPLVDKYYFYSNATKASGCHKYTLRLNDDETERDQITVDGKHYSSSSLADLPPKNAKGVVSSGAIQDFYVIYTVKEEYEKNYVYNLDYTETKDGDKVTAYNVTSETGTSQPYLVLQNGRFYKTENSASSNTSYISKPIFEHTTSASGNVYDLIVDPQNHGGNNDNIIDGSGNFLGNNFWYVKPNLNIDEEMGITWGTAISGAEPLSKVATQVTYKDKSGFDPYNIQLQLVNKNNGTPDGRYLTTHMTSAHLDDGIMVGVYNEDAGGTMKITLEAACASPISSEGYDHTNMQITNQTFMAVSDANGNMQLMPRFDHTKRVDLQKVSPWETQLRDPVDHAVASADDNASMGSQTTFFVTPKRYHYHIIDNNGREALRYKRGADFYPAITDHFKSPLAKDFTYYTGLAESNSPVESGVGEWSTAAGDFKKSLTKESMLADAVKLLPTAGTYYYRFGTRGQFTYKKVTVTKGLSEKEITGSFAAAGFNLVDNDVYVRYSYDEDADLDADRVLHGKWFTVKLADKDLQASGTVVVPEGATQGTGVNLYAGNDPLPGGSDPNDKPTTIDANAKKWQWKFLAAPTDPSSDYYVEPDPYAVQLFNRQANYTNNPSVEPSPMGVGIKVPNANDGADRFALLSHPSGGYGLVVAKTYTDYNYPFLNGASMTVPDAGTPQAATTENETSFNYKTGTISDGAQVILNNDVTYNYTYNVITNDNNGNKLAITANQLTEEAESHEYAPYVPESAQSPLLNMDDYLYYGFATVTVSAGTYSVIEQTKLYTLYGLYDDVVYVRYKPYSMDKTSFKVPNKKATAGGHVARDASSVDVSMNIEGGLPYNIIWYNDNMMMSDGSTVSDGGSHALTGDEKYIWYITGNDPYALKIKHKNGKYLDGTTTMVAEGDAQTFMLLRKSDYDYGVLQVTGTTGAYAGKKLTGFGGALTADANTAPTKYIIFGLSIHKLIYHLVIAKTCPNQSADHLPTDQYVDIPYREGNEDSWKNEGWTTYDAANPKITRIYGTTQRDLTSVNDGGGDHYPGEKYQLGSTLTWNGAAHTYSYDAGTVSIGDELVLPNIFYRPNCTFDFYIEGIYQHYATANDNEGKPYTEMNNKYKGLNLSKLMSDEGLIDQDVVVNVVYSFDKNVATNTGLGFVTSTDQNLWYTFETPEGETPYLGQYTNAWGLQAKAGRDTRYTNDYLWTPLGDVYGFKMYNRYMLKNSGGVSNVMTMNYMDNNENLYLAVPGVTTRTEGAESGTPIPAEYAVFELVSGDADGYFRVHPVANTSATKYYVWRDPSDNYTKLSTTPCDWRYGLEMDLLEPYYERAGYVGGLTAAGKTKYDEAVASGKITEIQKVVYNDTYIVHYTPGYYRLHSQPGVSGIDPVRYASGYLHDIERTHISGGIPMHFYSKEGVNTTFEGEDGLVSGFTETPATRGEIPIPATEQDPSTIFYIPGGINPEDLIDTHNPRVTLQTQGLYVAANANGDPDNGTTTDKRQRAVMSDNSANAITFSLMDIGGAVLLIHDGVTPASRRYLNYDQSVAANIYDLKYYHESPTDDAKWCMQPVQKTATAGNGEMPLTIATNNGGDGYYYATFYAPFDVLLPSDADGKTYNAYVCTVWNDAGINPNPVPAVGNTYAKGKFVPAGTPVIIRVKDESGSLTLTLPKTSPSASPVSCVFQGTCLEKKLAAADPVRDVYTLGVPMTSSVSEDADYDTTGKITAPLPEFATSGVGFYINATYNKESNSLQSLWQRNNLYVQHNKIYYRAPAPSSTRGVEFVPVLFDDIVEQATGISEAVVEDPRYDGHVYDLQGRCVATEEQVKDGTWRMNVKPGIYIFNGKKVFVKR